ncbi:hypothetical protein THALO_10044 [Tenacibaculum halocynthiae]
MFIIIYIGNKLIVYDKNMLIKSSILIIFEALKTNSTNEHEFISIKTHWSSC